jgi:FtsP/CotA-like multicopper oxidase with cupredoxin domain
MSEFRFRPGKTHLLRLINSGGEGLQRFSIDNHEMTVISHDYTPIQPYTANVVSLGVGQCMDVLVNATGASTDVVYMRSTISQIGCSLPTQPFAKAIIYYDAADTTATPSTNA